MSSSTSWFVTGSILPWNIPGTCWWHDDRSQVLGVLLILQEMSKLIWAHVEDKHTTIMQIGPWKYISYNRVPKSYWSFIFTHFSKAPSTRTRIFSMRAIIFSVFEKIHVHTDHIKIVFARPHVCVKAILILILLWEISWYKKISHLSGELSDELLEVSELSELIL